jgi:hypothetical protein
MARLGIHTFRSRFIPEGVAEASQTQESRRDDTPTFYTNYLAMRNLIAVYLSVSAVNPLVAFYDIHGRKR